MWIFYICSTLLVLIGLFIFIFNKNIVWKEWIAASLVSLIVAIFVHCVAFIGMTSDIETWSGVISKVEYHPAWREKYTETHTKTVGSGKNQRTVTYTDSHVRNHTKHWESKIDYGSESDSKEISKPTYEDIKLNLGGIIVEDGRQSSSHGGHLISGDRGIYSTYNKTGFIYPTTITKRFENRIKASPTVYSFATVPENVPVYKWPENNNWMCSSRLINESRIDILEFDRMNSRLGPSKEVNVIMINFGSNDSNIAQWQQAKWIGGKKNDIVLCYGQLNTNSVPAWSYVFSWSEKENCKKNLQSILLENKINNNILEKIENEIRQNFVRKDWHKFDYISIDPPKWSYYLYFFVVFSSQIAIWVWNHKNKFRK